MDWGTAVRLVVAALALCGAQRCLGSPLPTDVTPQNYKLQIHPVVDTDTSSGTFSGTVTINVLVANSTTSVTVHKDQALTVTQVTAYDVANKKDVAVSATDTSQTGLLKVTLGETLQAKQSYSLTFTFNGDMNQEEAGLYFSLYPAGYYGTRYVVGTHLAPTFARKVFPCFDEPHLLATFDITVSRTSEYYSLSNTELSTTSNASAGVVSDTFKQTPAIAPYQVAFLVLDYQAVETGVSGVRLHVPRDSVSSSSWAVQLVSSLLSALKDYTTLPMPASKLDIVAVPHLVEPAGQFYGVATFRLGYLLPSASVASDFEFLAAKTLAKQLALAWFADSVSISSWDDAWLREGLVEYLQYGILEKAGNGRYAPLSRIGIDEVQLAMSEDAEEPAEALNSAVVENPLQRISGLKAKKAASVFQMIATLVGEATFEKGIQQYLISNSNKAVSYDGLVSALQTAVTASSGTLPSSVTVQSVLDSWTSKPGVPVLTVTSNGAQGTVTVTQSRFLWQTSSATAAENWVVPLTVRLVNDTAAKPFEHALADDGKSVDVPLAGLAKDVAYILNWGQTGYYRVLYDADNYAALAASWSSLDASSKAAVLDDALALTRVGLLDIPTALTLLEQVLPYETTSPPWIAAYRALNLWRALLRATGESDKLFTLYVRQLMLDRAYAGVGWTRGKTDTVDFGAVRGIVSELACGYGVIACRKDALNAYLANPTDSDYFAATSGDVLAAEICEYMNDISVISNVSDTLNAYGASTDESHQLTILRGLPCVTKEALLHDYVIQGVLDYTQSINVLELFKAVTDRSRDGATGAINNLKQFFTTLTDQVNSPYLLNDIVIYVIQRISTDDQHNAMADLLEAQGLNTTLAYAMQDAAQTVQWIQRTALPQVTAHARAQLGLPSPTTPTTPVPTYPPGPLSTPIPPTQEPDDGPTDPPGVEDEWHLPSALQPLHYQLSITPYIHPASADSSFNGTVTITFLARQNTDVLELHAAASLAVQVTEFVHSDGTPVDHGNLRYSGDETEFIRVPVPGNLTLGDKYKVTFGFQGQLLRNNEGFYLSSYTELENLVTVTKYIATTQFEPTSARKAFPCFDEPRFKATFDITVGKLKSQSAISNMPVLTTVDDPSDAERDLVTFETTPPMSTYLVAFVVSELERLNTTDPRIHVYVRGSARLQAQLAADLAPSILAEMEEYSGIEYALPKLDLVAIPDFEAGAMENWGCITFRENRMLLEADDGPDRERSIAEVVAHEFSHLWFGDLVTVGQWSSLWQQEGMASLFQRYILDKATNNKYKALGWLEVEEVQDALAVDALENAEPLTNTTLTSPTALNDHMGTITYSKGAGFLRMIMDFIGESTFRKGLQNYLKANEYGWGTPENLAAGLEAAVTDDKVDTHGVKMVDLIDSWTLKPGYPLLTVTLDATNKVITIKQKRYLQYRTSNPSVLNATWIVPLKYTITDGTTSQVMSGVLDEQGDEYTLTNAPITMDSYILFNNDFGFYRVTYEPRTWMLLAQALSQRQVSSPALRAAILDDALSLARAGELESWVAFFVMQSALQVETDPLVWTTAHKHLLHYAALVSHNREMRKFFNWYVDQQLTAQTFSIFDWTSPWNVKDSQDDKYTRSFVSQLSCMAGNVLCTTRAYEDFHTWRKSPKSVRPEILGTVLCQGLANSELLDVVNAITLYDLEKDRSKRFAYVYGLGCIKDNVKLQSVLDSIVTGNGVEPQEVNSLLASIIANRANGVEFVLAYISDYIPLIVEKKGLEYASQLVQVVAERAYSISQFNKIQYLSLLYPTLDMKVALQSASQSVLWAENSGDFAEWIATQVGTDVSPVPKPQHTPTGSQGLPLSVQPDQVSITLGAIGPEDFVGSTTITLSVLEGTNSIQMHAAENVNITKVSVTTADKKAVNVSSTDRDALYEQVFFSLESALQVGQQYQLQIQFSTSLSKGKHPLRATDKVHVYDFSKGNARRILPCFDEPRFRSQFSVTVQVAEANKMAIFSSPLTGTNPFQYLERFLQTPSMPIQSLGLVVAAVAAAPSDVFDTYVYGTGGDADQVLPGVNAVQGVMTYLEAITGKGPDLQGNSIVAAPDSSIQTSTTWGLTLSSQSNFLRLLPASSTMDYKSWFTTLTQNVGNQWFGSLVAMDWWNNPWFTTGFSTYFSYRAGQQLYPEWDFDTWFMVEPVSEALVDDSYEYAGPLTIKDVNAISDEIAASYDSIATNKGAAVVSSILNVVGPDHADGLKQFFLENSYSATNPSKLITTLENNIQTSNNQLPKGVSLEEIARTWLNNPGYPVVNVMRNYQRSSMAISQERFLVHTPSEGVNTTGRWWVPLTVALGPSRSGWVPDSPTPQGWLRPQSSPVNFNDPARPSQYLVFNYDRSGLYRVNYDLWNWMLLGRVAPNSDSLPLLPAKARIVLLQDALALARTDRLEYIFALKWVDFLRLDTTAESWTAGRSALYDGLIPFLLETEAEAPYKSWMYSMLYTVTRTVKFNARPGGAGRTSVLRSLSMIWAVEAGDEEVIALAKRNYDLWISGNASIYLDTVAASVCAGANTATEKEFDTILEIIQNEMDATARESIIEGLGCMNDKVLTNRLLDETTSLTTLNAGEVDKVFKSVTRLGPSRVTLALQFLEQNWEKVLQGAGEDALVSSLVSIGVRVTTQAQYDVLSSIVDSLKSPAILKSSLLLAKDNLSWKEKNLELVTAWLTILGDSNFPEGTTTASPGPSGGSTTADVNPPTMGPNPHTHPFTLPTGSTRPHTLKPLTTSGGGTTARPQPTTEPSAAAGLYTSAALLTAALLLLAAH